MPTKPNLDFIPRDSRDDPILSGILDELSNLVKETVDFASQAIDWCRKNIKEGTEYALVFLIYRHIFEMIDAISVLITQSCIEPCKIFLRCIFEAFLSVEYILEKNMRQRAIGFIVYYRHKEIDILRRWDPKDDSYKEFDSLIKKDKIMNTWVRPVIPDVEEKLTFLRQTLAEEPFLDAEKDYQKFIKESKKHQPPRYWFNLYNGPNNLHDLSRDLGRGALYEVLYRQWSGLVHSGDIIRGKLEVDQSTKIGRFSQLRNPGGCELITFLAVSFAIYTIILFINNFAAEKKPDLDFWYKSEIKDKHTRLLGPKRIIVK